MQIISLKNFLLTSHFGPVHCGMQRDEVVRLLGEPGADNDFGYGNSGLCYAWFEIFYRNDTGVITAIQNDHLEFTGTRWYNDHVYFKTERSIIDPWLLRRQQKITFRKVVRALGRDRIPFTYIPHPDKSYGFQLKLSSGVTLDFEEPGMKKKTADLLLNGIRYFSPLFFE